MSKFVHSLSCSSRYRAGSHSMLAMQLAPLKEASEMTFDLGQEGQGVCRWESWKENIPAKALW